MYESDNFSTQTEPKPESRFASSQNLFYDSTVAAQVRSWLAPLPAHFLSQQKIKKTLDLFCECLKGPILYLLSDMYYFYPGLSLAQLMIQKTSTVLQKGAYSALRLRPQFELAATPSCSVLWCRDF